MGFFKRKADFRQAGIAMKKTGHFALRFDKHVVVAGTCSFQAQVKERRTPKIIQLVQGAQGSARSQRQQEHCYTRCQSMYSVGRDTQGKLFIAPPNAMRVELMPRYSHKLFRLVASSFVTGDKPWKPLSNFSRCRQTSFIRDSGVAIHWVSREKGTHLIGEAKKQYQRGGSVPYILPLSPVVGSLQTPRMMWRQPSEATPDYEANPGDDTME